MRKTPASHVAALRSWRLLSWLWPALLAAAPAMGKEPALFLHRRHLDEGADCSTCHEGEGEAPPVLTRKGCPDCHDSGVPDPVRLPARARPAPLAFPHRTHAAAMGCKECHAATMADAQEEGRPLVEAGRCLACHAENGVATPEGVCTRCHGRDMRRVPPSSHREGWQRRHGEEAGFAPRTGHGACTTCHRSDACTTCHRGLRPADHTSLWRVRTHGLAAFDRDRCRVCHETGSCIRCHQTTAPLNHTGAWRFVHGLAAGTRSNEHCGVCHRSAFCSNCHEGGR